MANKHHLKPSNLIAGLFLILLITFTSGCTDTGTYNPTNLYNDTDFENAKYNPYFIAARGIMPEHTNYAEKLKWHRSLENCIDKTIPGMEQYSPYSGGIVLLYGYRGKGYMEVQLNLDDVGNVSNSTIDDMYQIIDEYCKNKGIENVPVVFSEWYAPEQTPDSGWPRY